MTFWLFLSIIFIDSGLSVRSNDYLAIRNTKCMEQDQQFVEFVVKALVDHPDQVKTERVVDEMGVLITLHLSPEDMGQVIGRMGQTAKAIRTLLRVVGAKHKARVNLKIYEPEGSHRGPRREGGMGGGHSPMDMGMQDDANSIDEFKL